MKTFCCSNDVAARYGGEEFVLVLPETKVKGAVYIAERIREEMASQTFQHKGEQTIKAFITQDAQYHPRLSVCAIFVPCFCGPNWGVFVVMSVLEILDRWLASIYTTVWVGVIQNLFSFGRGFLTFCYVWCWFINSCFIWQFFFSGYNIQWLWR